MTTDRYGHTMTLLGNGKVLIAGGETCSSLTTCNALNNAELYDPAAGTFTGTGSLNAARFNASAVLLNSGQVLIASGFNGGFYPTLTAELYDPVGGTFSSTGNSTPRAYATATLLENSGGMVLIAGGSTCSSPGCPTATTEIYQNGAFHPIGNMTVSRYDQTATLLTNGQLFLAGGFDSCVSSCVSDATTELFNPQTNGFTSSQALTTWRSGHTATLLPDGSVLLIGGINNGVTLATTDSYQPSSLALPQLASITITPSRSPMALGTTLPLVATGYNSSGITLGPLQSVVWNSSSALVASVSNATGSAGIVNSLNGGTTAITASVGTISATAQITVTAPLVSIAVTPANPSIALNSSQALQLAATGIYADGSSNNLTRYVTWSSSNSSVATFMPNSSAQGTVVVPVGVGTANLTAVFDGVSGATSVSVLAPPTVVAPSIVNVSPTTGAAGTQVTITGSGFGANQGVGTVWLGTTLGAVVSWSDAQVIANENTGSASGVAQIQQGGVASNSVPFTVNTAAVSGATPTSGIAGTQVTITGSGFGAVQGSGIAWLGNAPGVVTSWSDGQVTATVAPGVASGTAQILQNGVWSNSIAFIINLPHVTGMNPNSGRAGTAVTISGSGFGAAQGSGTVWIGSTYGVVTSWSATQVVANVASSALSGIVKIQQNGTWSNAVTFTVSTSGGTTTPVTLVPNVINMLAGTSRSIQALNASNQSVTGLTWTLSNTSIAKLSTDDPPIITAVAAGNTTITAGNASADITVLAGTTFPTGTVICSNPGDASGATTILPAVPSATGMADVFSLQQDGNVLAITSDCLIAWTAFVGTGNNLIPDFQGGLVVANTQSINRLDGITGQAYPAYTSASGSALTTPVVHTDGTIFTVDGGTLVGINPQTGQPKFHVQMDQSSFYYFDPGIASGYVSPGVCGAEIVGPPSTGSALYPPNVGQLIIAGDGYAYILYTYYDNSTDIRSLNGYTSTDAITESLHLRLLRVGTEGDSYLIPLGDWNYNYLFSGVPFCFAGGSSISQSAPIPFIDWATPITNTDTGVSVSWLTLIPAYCAVTSGNTSGGCVGENDTFHLATTSGTTATPVTPSFIPGQVSAIQPVVQRSDGSYVGIVSAQQGNMMVAFDQSGKTLWTVPNDGPQIATSDGGVIGASGVTYNQNGNASGQIADLNQSWTENTYQLGSIERLMNASIIPPAPSYWSFSAANQSGNQTSPVCRDNRDKIIAEYPAYNADFLPVCFMPEFVPSTNVRPTVDFSFTELNLDDVQYGDYPDWAILQPKMLAGLELWRGFSGGPLKIKSGYRTPYVQHLLSPQYPNDEHIRGDAVDVASNADTYTALRAAAWAAQACVEPLFKQKDGDHHVHGQWKKPCPNAFWMPVKKKGDQ